MVANNNKEEFIIKDKKLAKKLVLEELFDYMLYKKLAGITSGGLKKLLEELIPIEKEHFHFWQDFFHLKLQKLNFLRQTKLWFIYGGCWIFGEKAAHLALESIEIYGTRKYLMAWDQYKNTPLGDALRKILTDELGHEDAMVSRFIERRVSGERIRDVFLGLNDGLVEILGAVSGFFAVFSGPSSVLMAGLTVAVAGSLSMGAGVFVATGSEKEVELAEKRKDQFFGKAGQRAHKHEGALYNALVVGTSYFIGALIPISPVLIGATNVLASIIVSGTAIVLVSFIVAFVSGMNIKKRIIINVMVIAAAVVITYAIGIFVRNIWKVRV